VRVLGHITDARASFCGSRAEHAKSPAAGVVQAENELDESRLAAAVGSDDHREVAVLDSKGDSLEHEISTIETEAQVVDFDHRFTSAWAVAAAAHSLSSRATPARAVLMA